MDQELMLSNQDIHLEILSELVMILCSANDLYNSMCAPLHAAQTGLSQLSAAQSSPVSPLLTTPIHSPEEEDILELDFSRICTFPSLLVSTESTPPSAAQLFATGIFEASPAINKSAGWLSPFFVDPPGIQHHLGILHASMGQYLGILTMRSLSTSEVCDLFEASCLVCYSAMASKMDSCTKKGHESTAISCLVHSMITPSHHLQVLLPSWSNVRFLDPTCCSPSHGLQAVAARLCLHS